MLTPLHWNVASGFRYVFVLYIALRSTHLTSSALLFVDIKLLRLLARSTSRLTANSTTSSLSLAGLSNILDVATERLVVAETSLDCSLHEWTPSMNSCVLPPHSSHGLHRHSFESELDSWGHAVEELWKASMASEVKGAAWDRLTPRLLVWRATVGERNSPVGEWARREMLSMLLC